MIERLNQLSLAQFIELSCGNNSVLLGENEKVPEDEIKRRASGLIAEYHAIANPTGMQSMLVTKDDLLKLNARLFLFKICRALCLAEGWQEARDAISELYPAYKSKSDEQLQSDIDNLLREAEFQKKRMDAMTTEEASVSDENSIRSSFDSEIAFITTHFKMPIDIHIINAAVYANIVYRADMEIKLKMRSL